VLVGRRSADRLVYSTVNACICPLGSLQDCHILTVEGLSSGAETLHPVQAAMVECNGSQCGFCTPGMIMSAIDICQNYPNSNEKEIRELLEGNLCRCTGYQNIITAVQVALKSIPLSNN
jgi:xanthine dehydrogenase iron-sulfur cluster and FAD-binding subunit A